MTPLAGSITGVLVMPSSGMLLHAAFAGTGVPRCVDQLIAPVDASSEYTVSFSVPTNTEFPDTNGSV